MEKAEKKCWKCGRILIRKSKAGLCPKCVDQIEKWGAGIAGGAGVIFYVARKVGKEGLKHILKL